MVNTYYNNALLPSKKTQSASQSHSSTNTVAHPLRCRTLAPTYTYQEQCLAQGHFGRFSSPGKGGNWTCDLSISSTYICKNFDKKTKFNKFFQIESNSPTILVSKPASERSTKNCMEINDTSNCFMLCNVEVVQEGGCSYATVKLHVGLRSHSCVLKYLITHIFPTVRKFVNPHHVVKQSETGHA